MDVQVTSKSVNSKLLFTAISEAIKEGIRQVDLTWSNEEERSVFLDYLNSLLHEVWNQGKIEQWKVQCNSLNNKADDMLNGKFILDVNYRQKHCLNVTKITFTIRENE